MPHRVAVIGGGAAGFFAAITCKAHCPEAVVTIYEKTDKLLAKVKVSGGGRCNVTTSCSNISELVAHYPRGNRQLKKSFVQFGPLDTVQWFLERGVQLKTETDGRMFPITDSSQTIIDCLMSEVQRLGVTIRKQSPIQRLEPLENDFAIHFTEGHVEHTDRVIIASGGSPSPTAYAWLHDIGHAIVAPLPSLFTFNMPNEAITELMGVVANPVSVRIQGQKLQTEGPLLITHWGMSGPAILKLSAFGARILYELAYTFNVQVNWLNITNEENAREILNLHRTKHPQQQSSNANPVGLPSRLWQFLLERAGINAETKWTDIQGKPMNRLLNILLNDVYSAKGKTTFKEEFVTCGGVSLEDINMTTMESRHTHGLYFAGEVIDVDGVTGGFNFQAAWTTGFIAGRACAASLSV